MFHRLLWLLYYIQTAQSMRRWVKARCICCLSGSNDNSTFMSISTSQTNQNGPIHNPLISTPQRRQKRLPLSPLTPSPLTSPRTQESHTINWSHSSQDSRKVRFLDNCKCSSFGSTTSGGSSSAGILKPLSQLYLWNGNPSDPGSTSSFSLPSPISDESSNKTMIDIDTRSLFNFDGIDNQIASQITYSPYQKLRRSNKTSNNGSNKTSNNWSRFVGIMKHIPSELKLLFGIDCEVLIDMIPITNAVYRNHSIWQEYDLIYEELRSYLIDECLEKYNELYDKSVEDIKIDITEPSSHIKSNLVMLNLETTILTSIPKDIDSEVPSPVEYNKRDLVFGYLRNAKQIDDIFSVEDADEHLLLFRKGLMELLYEIVSGEQNEFDVMTYIGDNPYVSYFNIILIEMYFNWYYLIINDPSLNRESHEKLLFKFTFAIPTVKHTKRKHVFKKSLHAIENIIGKKVHLYDRIIILDGMTEWDRRIPISSSNLWRNVFGIKATKMLLTSSIDFQTLLLQRNTDPFLTYVKRFFESIDKVTRMMKSIWFGLVHMDWYEIDHEGIRRMSVYNKSPQTRKSKPDKQDYNMTFSQSESAINQTKKH